MSSRWLTTGGLLLGAALLLALNLFSDAALRSARVDFTDQRLYTLSEGTRRVLGSLEEPVHLRLFLSRRFVTGLPGIDSYAKRVRELLEEYQRAGAGKVRLSIIDPEPFTEEEDRALGHGLRGIPLDEEAIFYFGIVATGSTDQEELIPYLTREREELLEYDLTRLIYKVVHPKQKVVGLLSSLPLDGLEAGLAMSGQRPQPWMVLEQMRQLFEVRRLDEGSNEIPQDVGVLMIVHPKGLSDETLYAIDQFVLHGGRALVFVDPHAEADRGPPPNLLTATTAGRESQLDTLLAAWGMELSKAKVVGDLQLATRVQFPREGRVLMMDYPLWMTLPAPLLNHEDIVTADLASVRLGSPGYLTKKEAATTRVTPLIQSSPNAMAIGAERVGFFADPQDTVRNYQPDGKNYVLAARITGQAASAFPGGPPARDAKPSETGAPKGATPARPPKANGDINVIVVADTDLLQDEFWVQIQDFFGNRIAVPNAGNGAFVVNALDNLSGSDALISVRSRGRFTRPFTRVNALRQEAELQFRQKEQELVNQLQETEMRLAELERGKGESSAVVLTEAQQQELARFRQEKIRIRNDLRQVRRELRKNIEGLEDRLKFVNIGLMPLLIGIGGIGVGAYQLQRRKRGVRSTADRRE